MIHESGSIPSSREKGSEELGKMKDFIVKRVQGEGVALVNSGLVVATSPSRRESGVYQADDLTSANQAIPD